MAFDIEKIRFDEKGLVPCVVQDYETKRVLTVAYMNRESLEVTLKKGLTCFWSRSRQELWLKGATSGNYQHLVSLQADCDQDALLALVRKDGPACHRGTDSCFDDSMEQDWDDEFCDIYDKDRTNTGRVIRRSSRLSEGEYLLYVLALLENRDHKFLITRRTFDKKWAAGWWEVTGGAARAGESSFEAVCREVREETGLDVSSCRESGQIPKPADTYCNTDPERHDNYFMDIYHFRLDFSREDIHPQKSEVMDYRLADWDEIRTIEADRHFLHFNRLETCLKQEGIIGKG